MTPAPLPPAPLPPAPERSLKLSLGAFSRMSLASAAQALSGLVRMKIVAVLLGPAGVGVYGLFYALSQTVAVFGALGQDLAGPRQIAQARAREGTEDPAQVIWAVCLLLAGLAAACGGGFLLSAGWIARLLARPEDATEIAWLSVAVVLAILALVPVITLQGLREIGRLAQVNLWAAVAAMIAGGGAVLVLGGAGIVVMIIAAPACLLCAGGVALLGLRRGLVRPRLSEVLAILRGLVARGAPFMLVSMTVIGTAFAARGLVQQVLGAEALGLYTAATSIATTYLALVLVALSADYLPSLSAAIHRPAEAARLVAEQVEVVQLIVIPVALAVFAAAPLVMTWLFSAEFAAAAPILRWLAVADIIRVMVWPVGFVLLARGEGMRYFLVEASLQLVFLGLTFLVAREVGLSATALVFPVMAVVTVSVIWRVVRRRMALPPFAGLLPLPVCALCLAGLTALVSTLSPLVGLWLGLGLSLGLAVHAVLRLSRLAGLGGPVGLVAAKVRDGLRRFGLRV